MREPVHAIMEAAKDPCCLISAKLLFAARINKKQLVCWARFCSLICIPLKIKAMQFSFSKCHGCDYGFSFLSRKSVFLEVLLFII